MADAPTISPKENGPYLVTGCSVLKGMADGTVYPSAGTVALCRCGGSKNKPFCDGTHAKNGFTSARADDRVPDARDTYVGRGVTVHDNRGICAHAARCTDAWNCLQARRRALDRSRRCIRRQRQRGGRAMSFWGS